MDTWPGRKGRALTVRAGRVGHRAWERAPNRLGAVAAYALMIPLLRRVRRRVELRAFAQCWNLARAPMGFAQRASGCTARLLGIRVVRVALARLTAEALHRREQEDASSAAAEARRVQHSTPHDPARVAPDRGRGRADLAHVPELPAEYDAWTAPWRGYELHFYSLARVRFFNGFAWSRASARAWHLPLGAVAAYALMIPLLRRVRRRVELRAFAQCWNFGLALFSAMGFCACAPVLLTELYRNGFYFTCCAPAPWYGGGVCGLFVALFIYSKFAELAPPRRPDEARAFFAARSRAGRHRPHLAGEAPPHLPPLVAPRDGPALQIEAGHRTARRSRPSYFACGSRRQLPFLVASALMRLLRLHGRRAPAVPRQEARHFRDAAAARPDGRRHRRDRPRRPVPDRGRRCP